MLAEIVLPTSVKVLLWVIAIAVGTPVALGFLFLLGIAVLATIEWWRNRSDED